MTPPEYGVWLVLGVVTLLAMTMVFLPVRGGHGQHAHAGPGTLTVSHLTRAGDPDDEIVWPSEAEREEPDPTPLERNLARLCAHPEGEYVGRHRLDEPYELYEPPPGRHLELELPTPDLVRL